MSSPIDLCAPDEYFVQFDIIENNKLRIYATKTMNDILNEYQSEYDLFELKTISHFFDKYNSINEVYDDFHVMFQNDEMSITNKGLHLHLDWKLQEYQEFTGKAIMPIYLVSSTQIGTKKNIESLLEENQSLLEKLKKLQEINKVNDEERQKFLEQLNQLQGQQKYDDINSLLKQEIDKLQSEVELLKERNSELINKQNELIDRIKYLETNTVEQKEMSENFTSTENNPLKNQGQQYEIHTNESYQQTDFNQKCNYNQQPDYNPQTNFNLRADLNRQINEDNQQDEFNKQADYNQEINENNQQIKENNQEENYNKQADFNLQDQNNQQDEFIQQTEFTQQTNENKQQTNEKNQQTDFSHRINESNQQEEFNKQANFNQQDEFNKHVDLNQQANENNQQKNYNQQDGYNQQTDTNQQINENSQQEGFNQQTEFNQRADFNQQTEFNQQANFNQRADFNQQTYFNQIIKTTAENVAKNSLVFDNTSDLKLIENKINKGELKYTLLFRASKDGDTAAVFHQKCNGLSNTLIIIKTLDGKKFGGYTTQSWEGNNIYKQDENAFVFSLDKQKCYSITEEKFAIWCFENCGPIFEGYQIDVEDNFLTTGVCQTGLEGVGFETTEDYELNDGKENFIISEMEVYKIEF